MSQTVQQAHNRKNVSAWPANKFVYETVSDIFWNGSDQKTVIANFTIVND